MTGHRGMAGRYGARDPDRDAALLAALARGITHVEIAGEFRLSVSRVAQLAAEWRAAGLLPPPVLRHPRRNLSGAALMLESEGAVDFIEAEDDAAREALSRFGVVYPEAAAARAERFCPVQALRNGKRLVVSHGSGAGSPAAMCAGLALSRGQRW